MYSSPYRIQQKVTLKRAILDKHLYSFGGDEIG
jgi:hypothetical protein